MNYIQFASQKVRLTGFYSGKIQISGKIKIQVKFRFRLNQKHELARHERKGFDKNPQKIFSMM